MSISGLPKKAKLNTIFGTDGVRGKSGSELTPDLIYELGYCFGKLGTKGESPILIGQDSRNSSDMFAQALTAGLKATGWEVWLLGLCPTPAVPFLIEKYNLSGGLMVTASHNPPEDNGIKFFEAGGEKISAELQEAIANCIVAPKQNPKYLSKPRSSKNSYIKQDLLKDYKNDLIKSLEKTTLNNCKIVLDLCWGSATSCALDIFTAIGANVVVINGAPNGDSINVGCGSTNLAPLKEAVLTNCADVGFAFDGDADRMLAIDSQGRLIDGDHILYLWGSYLKDKNELNRSTLVSTVMSNLGFEKAWKMKGGNLSRTPVGDQNVYKEMKNNGIVLGGEQSGHILHKGNNLRGDGLYTALQLCILTKRLGLTFDEWRNKSFKSFPQKLINIPISQVVKTQNSWRKCTQIKEAVRKAEAEIGEYGRVLLRPSGTEPILRVMVEAEDPHLVSSWSKHLAAIVEENVQAA